MTNPLLLIKSLVPVCLAVCVAIGGVGCGSSETVTPSVSGAFPQTAFRGRTLDVVLSGSGTKWDQTATVSFGDGITVNKVTPASLTALVANITVTDAAAEGPRDITVTSLGDVEPYKMAFSIASPIEVVVQGTTAQGSIVGLTIKNKDLEHLFDDTSTGGSIFSAPTFTNIAINTPTGTAVNISNVTPFRIDATMFIDVKATTAKFDLKVKSGPEGGKRDDFNFPALFDIAARTAEALPATGAMFTLDKPLGSKLYTFTPGGVDHLIELAATGDDAAANAQVVVLKQSGAFADLLGNGASYSWTADATTPVYVIVFDNSGGSGYNVAVSASDITLAIQAGGEGDSTANNVYTGAIVLSTPPVRVKGASLSAVTDVDWYKVTVPAGKLIHARTVPGDANTDTVVSFYGTDGTTKIGTDADNGNHEDVVSNALPAAGDYYIKVSASSYYAATATHYDLIVTLD